MSSLKLSSLPPIIGSDSFCGIERILLNGSIVLTTAQIAKFFECSENIVRANFQQGNFVNGVHFFKLEGAPLKNFKDYVKNFNIIHLRTPILYLWTEYGVQSQCKMIGTKKAVEVFSAMQDNFFQAYDDNRNLEISERERVEFLYKLACMSEDKNFREKLLHKAAFILTGEVFGSISDESTES